MTVPNEKRGFILQNGLTLYPKHDQAIDEVLGELEKLCKTRLILLTDTSGQLISMHGTRGEASVISLGSLAAGDLAASQEIARLTGELDRSQIIIREGTSVFTFITAVGREMVLFVQTWRETPPGWSRLLILKAARKLEEVISVSVGEVQKIDLDLGAPDAGDRISSSLDTMWTEDGNVHQLESS
jgi:predicted regulator of Ras-like GTPase activity (Roadblock/LC7/MglB family)